MLPVVRATDVNFVVNNKSRQNVRATLPQCRRDQEPPAVGARPVGEIDDLSRFAVNEFPWFR